jgi:hypothetical protein
VDLTLKRCGRGVDGDLTIVEPAPSIGSRIEAARGTHPPTRPGARRTALVRSNPFAWSLFVMVCGCADATVSTVDAGGARDGAATADAPAVDDASPRTDAANLPCITGSGVEGPDRTRFDTAGLTTPITEESCTLSNGTTATCLRIQLRGAPSDHAVGPFCPRTITDPASAAGLWISGGRAYDLDGAFVRQLATFYSDATWQLYDAATGRVRVTETRAACEAAARPNVDPMYNNYCVECALSYVNGGVATTLLIPARPVARPAPQDVGNMTVVGAALNGVAFDPPAPVQAILAAHTIAAFDDCGGHVNLAAGYHYHAATGCSRSYPSCDGHAPLIGYAADGYAIHGMRNGDGNEPADLDGCRGHTDAARGYHYHVASAGENLFIGCFHGYTVAGATGMMPPDGGMMPGGTAMMCAMGQTSRCCGDGVCDGPENTTNCSHDCR